MFHSKVLINTKQTTKISMYSLSSTLLYVTKKTELCKGFIYSLSVIVIVIKSEKQVSPYERTPLNRGKVIQPVCRYDIVRKMRLLMYTIRDNLRYGSVHLENFLTMNEEKLFNYEGLLKGVGEQIEYVSGNAGNMCIYDSEVFQSIRLEDYYFQSEAILHEIRGFEGMVLRYIFKDVIELESSLKALYLTEKLFTKGKWYKTVLTNCVDSRYYNEWSRLESTVSQNLKQRHDGLQLSTVREILPVF